jgi:hypothetical protein
MKPSRDRSAGWPKTYYKMYGAKLLRPQARQDRPPSNRAEKRRAAKLARSKPDVPRA